MDLQNLHHKYFNWLKPEALEQANLVLRLEYKGYTYTSIPNSTYTQSIKQKILNKMTWLNSWLCDLLIILKRWSLLFLELKRAKKSLSKVSKEQQEWINNLNNINNVEAIICYGCEEAIEQIKFLENK